MGASLLRVPDERQHAIDRWSCLHMCIPEHPSGIASFGMANCFGSIIALTQMVWELVEVA